LWDKLKEHDSKNYIMMTGNVRETVDYKHLITKHAYTVLGVKELSNGVKLVKLRNPWGLEGYNGDWSDKSPLWTPELRAEAGAVDKNDGFIHMTVEFYRATFPSTDFIRDTTNMSKASFLRFNDEAPTTTLGEDCKTLGCRVHVVNITSTVAQTVTV